jgi:hypothetical protein
VGGGNYSFHPKKKFTAHLQNAVRRQV